MWSLTFSLEIQRARQAAHNRSRCEASCVSIRGQIAVLQYCALLQRGPANALDHSVTKSCQYVVSCVGNYKLADNVLVTNADARGISKKRRGLSEAGARQQSIVRENGVG